LRILRILRISSGDIYSGIIHRRGAYLAGEIRAHLARILIVGCSRRLVYYFHLFDIAARSHYQGNCHNNE
jgi:hypothetical protein